MNDEALNIPDDSKLITHEQKQAVKDAIDILKKSVTDMDEHERLATIMTLVDWVVSTIIVTNSKKNVVFASEAADIHYMHLRKYIAIAWVHGLLEFPEPKEPT